MRMFIPNLIVVVALAGCNQSAPSPAARVPADAQAPGENARVVRNTATPDNTAVNKRDAEANTKTPLDQKENQADVNLTAKIRREVLDVKDLSIDARNAKIITADGKVTLRGPVQSAEERDTLARIALAVAGEGNVDNQLEVAATATPNNRR
jgi:osmotically-inducible protein OsmY